jgi:RNA polymerase sigma factor (sigma-70 family)
MAELNTRLTLIARIKDQQDERSWEDFAHYYKNYLTAVIVNMGVNRSECDDITQHVLLTVWQEIPSFDYQSDRGKFRSWLARIAWNYVRKFFRNSHRLTKAVEDGHLPKLERYLKDSQEAEIEGVFQTEWEVYIAKLAWGNIAAGLNEKVRSLFEQYMNDIDEKTIAANLEIPLASLRVYKGRVKVKLCHEIKRLEDELC